MPSRRTHSLSLCCYTARDLDTIGTEEETGSFVAEMGTHDELMEIEDGAYNALVRLQAIATSG